jgi:hypothetical protein
MSMIGTPNSAYRPCRVACTKKPPSSRFDSTDDDESTMTSPKTTRKIVVPSSRK